MTRFSVYDYRDENGRDVLVGVPPYAQDAARAASLGIDTGMCPACKRGGMPRRWRNGEAYYLPHARCLGSRAKAGAR
jgi:hypothetical protein